MDAEKTKKLQSYATLLVEQAREEEKNGKTDEAIKHYLKLVDVFLVLAAEAPDHNTWAQYIRQAEAYQTRTRSLIPKDQPVQAATVSTASEPTANLKDKHPALSNQGTGLDFADNAARDAKGSNSGTTTGAKSSPFMKILKPFQKTEVTESVSAETSRLLKQQQSSGRSSSASITSNNNRSGSLSHRQLVPQSQGIPGTQTTAAGSAAGASENAVSYELYQRMLSENKNLRDKLAAQARERNEQTAMLESKIKELEVTISGMVPRTDYEALQLELENMVPRIDHEHVLTELASSVPRSQYDDLMMRLSSMVPRELYLSSERRAFELENSLKSTVPRKLIDDLASEISLLGVLAQVPLDEEVEKMTNEDVKQQEVDQQDELVKEEAEETGI